MPKFCKYCGAPRSDNSKFCNNCGKPFEQTAPNMPQGQYRQSAPNMNPQYRAPSSPQYRQGAPQPQYRQGAPQPQYRAPVPPPQYRNAPKKKSGRGGLIAFLIICAAAVFGVTGFWKPGFLRDAVGLPGKTVKVADGKMEIDGFSVDLSGTKVKDGEASLTAESKKKADELKEDGLVSGLFSLTYDEGTEGPVTVSMPVPKEYEPSDDSALRLGIGIEHEDDGKKITSYDYIEADIKGNTVSATFDPKDYPKDGFFGRESLESALSAISSLTGQKKDYGPVKVYCGFTFSRNFHFEKGHFNVWYPFTYKVNKEDQKSLLEDLEYAYSLYEDKGYRMGSGKYPMDVELSRKLDKDGESDGKSMTLKTEFIFGPETSTLGAAPSYPAHQMDARTVIRHEFFHTIQYNYLGWMTTKEITAKWQESLWLDEATAVYYEMQEDGSGVTRHNNYSDLYSEYAWTGVIPSDKMLQENGYGRAPLIAYVTEQLGSDEWIKTIYEEYADEWESVNDTTEKIFSSVPGSLAADFYREFLMGRYSGTTPGRSFDLIKKNLLVSSKARNNELYDVSSYTTIGLPEDEEKAKEAIAKNEPVTLYEDDPEITGQGAYIFALDYADYEEFPEDYQLSFSCENSTVTIIEVDAFLEDGDGSGKVITKNPIPIKDMRKAYENSKAFLVLCVSNGAVDTKSAHKFTVIAGPAEELPLQGTWNIEATGSYSSGLLDSIVGLMQGSAQQNDPDDVLGLSQLGDLYKQSQENQTTSGKMTIRKTEQPDIFDVRMKFGNGSPKQDYTGTFDPVKKTMVLKQKDTTHTSSNGNTYDLSKMGLAAELNFKFVDEKNPETNEIIKITFTGDSKLDSSMVSYEATYSGEKISDEVEEL